MSKRPTPYGVITVAITALAVTGSFKLPQYSLLCGDNKCTMSNVDM